MNQSLFGTKKCPKCNGCGYYLSNRCPRCDGKGKVLKSTGKLPAKQSR